MITKKFVAIVLLCTTCIFVKAQVAECNRSLSTINESRVSTSASNINVVYQKIFWRINPDTLVSLTTRPYLRGKVTTYFVTSTANVSSISFDLSKASYQTGLVAKYNGATVSTSFPTTGNVDLLTINLPKAIANAGTLDSVTIEYRGFAPAINGEAYGLQRSGSSTSLISSGYYYWTLAESYEDKNFFPCKQDYSDKIDSLQITISCPSAHVGVANGKLVSTKTTTIGKEYTYKTNYPIASYLVAFSVGRFRTYTRTPVNVNGTQVPITYYRRSSMTSTQLAAADANRSLMTIFGNLIGEYPFKNDGYGMMEFGFGGGMEHQTMSSMSSSSFTGFSIIAHELAHQWFGDKVTFTDWNDLWIAEGFAKYFESIAAEFDGVTTTDAVAFRNSTKSTALSSTAAPITITNITNSNTIWTSANNASVYNRGAMAVSMLRKLMGDTKFFNACKAFLNSPNHAYKSITTEELKTFFEAESGLNLTEFFNDWIYGKGNPTYAIKWGNYGKNINITLKQTVSAGSTVANFSTPIALRITNTTGGDTTVVIFDENNANATTPISFNLSFTPTAVTLDPFHDVLITRVGAGSTVTIDNSLTTLQSNTDLINEESIAKEYIKVVGNPAIKNLQLNFDLNTATNATQLNLIDMMGKVVKTVRLNGATTYETSIEQLKKGQYIVVVTNSKNIVIGTAPFIKQ
jgi:aminopeptidase N